jgi:hypothetical protein
MALTQYNLRNVASGTASDSEVAVHLLLTEGEMNLTADNPERVMDEIHIRAERVGAVLEAILLEPHGRPQWGTED